MSEEFCIAPDAKATITINAFELQPAINELRIDFIRILAYVSSRMGSALDKIWIGLPAFNEEVAVDRLLMKFSVLFNGESLRYEIVLYDDGSTDRTLSIAKTWASRLNLKLIEGDTNKGLGEGLRSLVAYAATHGAENDYFFLMDCDDTHDPIQIKDMRHILDTGADIVIASRYRKDAVVIGVPFYRRLLSLGAALLFKALHPFHGVLDYTCGYRGYRISILQKATAAYGDDLITNRGFACMVELLLKLRPFARVTKEIPLQLRYDLKPTASKMDVGGNTTQLLWLLTKWRLFGMNS